VGAPASTRWQSRQASARLVTPPEEDSFAFALIVSMVGYLLP
jgi:hypothetical protein